MNPTISAKAQSAINLALSRKGQFAGFLWNRPMKTRKGISSLVTKEVRCVARVGIDYDKQAKVLEGRANGELPEVNNGLPWGQWKQFPYLIEHTNKTGEENLYLRIYPLSNSKPKVIYRINGQIARKEEIEGLCLASEFKEDNGDRTCITLNVNNLQRMK